MTARGYIRALPALIRQDIAEVMFRRYVSDALHIAFGLNMRYEDMIPDPDRKPPPDPKEGRERIRKKLSG